MPTYRIEGIIIKRTDFSEADRILTVFTKDRGKISVLAKGVKKITSKKAGHIDLLNHSLMVVAEGRNLHILTEAETVDPFRGIKEDLDKSGLGYYIAEFINEFVAEGQTNYSLFRLILMALSYLDGAEDDRGPLLVRAFELKALGELGFAPEMRCCVHCGGPLSWGGGNGFSPSLGGVVCGQCIADGFPAGKAVLGVLRGLAEESWHKINRMKLERGEREKAGELLRMYVEYLLEKRLKSTELLEKLRSASFASG